VPPQQQAAVNHHGDNLQTQQQSPTTMEPHLIPESQNGKAVTIFPNKLSASNDQLISIDGENNELHGDWLLVTRKKKVTNNPASLSSKNS
jgi:hypothetical protein